jgi:hypothetical protein
MKSFLAVLCGAALLLPGSSFASTAVLAEPVKFPVTMNGRRIGESTVQAGTTVKVLGQTGTRVRIQYGSAEPVWVESGAVRDLRVVEAAAETPAEAPSAAGDDAPTPKESPAATPTDEPSAETDDNLAAPEGKSADHKPAAESSASSGGPTSFEIELKEGKVTVERYGTGDTGIIFFSNSGDMAADIRKAMEHYQSLCDKGCSLFLWRYPSSGPFAEVNKAIDSFMREQNEGSVDFTGVAAAVVEGIRKESGLQKFVLAGNSLGGGVILWDHASLAKDENLKFLLVAPTEVFMPDIDKIGPMDRTTLIAHRRGDDFVRDRKILSWIAANQSPLTREAESRDGHIIVGRDLGHEQFAAALASILNLPAR